MSIVDGLMYVSLIFPVVMGLNIGFTLLNIPAAINELMELYGVSYGKISILVSALLWSHAFIQIPAGMITDRIHVKPALLLSLGFMTAGNLLPVIIPDLLIAIAGRIVAGFGTGQAFISTLKLVALNAPEKKVGVYQAYHGAAISVGSIFAYLLVPHVFEYSWRWVYLGAGLFSGAMLVPAILLKVGGTPSFAPAPLPLGKILLIPVAWIIGVYHALSWGSMLSLGSWVPSLLAEVWNLPSSAKLAWGGALVLFISCVGRGCGGMLLAYFPPRKMANGTVFVLSVLFLSFFMTSIPWTVLGLAVLAAWFASINFGALFHLASKTVSSESLATLLGFVNLLANLGAILFTLAFGWSKEITGSFSSGFLFMSLVGFSALLVGRRVLARLFPST